MSGAARESDQCGGGNDTGTPSLHCDHCAKELGIAETFDACQRSWPVGRWAMFVCPTCDKVTILELYDGRVFAGEWDAVPPRELYHTQEVVVPGLTVEILPDGIGLELGHTRWHVPDKG